MARNYKKETSYEEGSEQVKRREARNAARRKALAKGTVHKGDNKQLDHLGFHPHGSLRKVPTRVVSAHRNLTRQPPHKGV